MPQLQSLRTLEPVCHSKREAHAAQRRARVPERKILRATTETRCKPKKEKVKKKKKRKESGSNVVP